MGGGWMESVFDFVTCSNGHRAPKGHKTLKAVPTSHLVVAITPPDFGADSKQARKQEAMIARETFY